MASDTTPTGGVVQILCKDKLGHLKASELSFSLVRALDTGREGNKRYNASQHITMRRSLQYDTPQDARSTESDSRSFEGGPATSSSAKSVDSDSIGLPIPAGYSLAPYKAKPVPHNHQRDEERLIMLAKHPNATEGQVAEILQRQEQAKTIRAARQALQQQEAGQTTSSGQVTETEQPWSDDNMPPQKEPRRMRPAGNDSQFEHVWNGKHTQTTMISPENNREMPPPKESFLVSFWRRAFPYPDKESDTVSRQGGMSLTSDQTPRISNVDERARAKRIRHEMGTYTCGDRCEHVVHRLTRTRQGLVVLFLLIILVLAILVTIVAALMAAKEDDDRSTLIPRPGTGGPDYDTDAPTGAPTFPIATTMEPTIAESPTAQPPPFVPTLQPTHRPSLRPTTAAPSEEGDTPRPTSTVSASPTGSPTTPPTRAPTLTPTMTPTSPPTTSPTASPTTSPTTPFPTLSPTFTSAPSSSPTTDFQGTQLEELGDPLLGSEKAERFGYSVALSEDGTILAVGIPYAAVDGNSQAGMAQVYKWNGNSWSDRGAAITGRQGGDQLGSVVSLSRDGNILAVSEPTSDGAGVGHRAGNVRVFRFNDAQEYELLGDELPGAAASDHFGVSIALSGDGRRLAVGAHYHVNDGDATGAASVYSLSDDDEWTSIVSFFGTSDFDWFGYKVDLSDDGTVLCAGAPRNRQFGGYVHCYENDGPPESWTLMGTIIRNTIDSTRYFGSALSIAGNNRVVVGALFNSGLVVVYQYDSDANKWSRLGGAVTPDSEMSGKEMGYAVDLLGDMLVVSTPGLAQVDRYYYTEGDWYRHPTPVKGPKGSAFGSAVSLRSSALAIGSPETDTGMVNVYQSQ